MKDDELIFGEDYYYNQDGFMVFTAVYLKKRGYCCRSGCRHCPYGFSAEAVARKLTALPSDDEI